MPVPRNKKPTKAPQILVKTSNSLVIKGESEALVKVSDHNLDFKNINLVRKAKWDARGEVVASIAGKLNLTVTLNALLNFAYEVEKHQFIAMSSYSIMQGRKVIATYKVSENPSTMEWEVNTDLITFCNVD